MHNSLTSEQVDNMRQVRQKLEISRQRTALDIDFRRESRKQENDDLQKILSRPRRAINEDSESSDSEEDEDLKAAKRVIFMKKSVRKSSDDFTSEEEY